MTIEDRQEILIAEEATDREREICDGYWGLAYCSKRGQMRHAFSVVMLRKMFSLKQTELLSLVQELSCAVSPLQKCQKCHGYLGAMRVRTAEYETPPPLIGSAEFLKNVSFRDRQLLTTLSLIEPEMGLCESCARELKSIDDNAESMEALLPAIIVASAIKHGAIDDLSPLAVLLLDSMTKLGSFTKAYVTLKLSRDEAEALYLECKRNSCLLVDSSGWWFPGGTQERDLLALLPPVMIGRNNQRDTHVESLFSKEIQSKVQKLKQLHDEKLKVEMQNRIKFLRNKQG